MEELLRTSGTCAPQKLMSSRSRVSFIRAWPTRHTPHTQVGEGFRPHEAFLCWAKFRPEEQNKRRLRPWSASLSCARPAAASNCRVAHLSGNEGAFHRGGQRPSRQRLFLFQTFGPPSGKPSWTGCSRRKARWRTCQGLRDKDEEVHLCKVAPKGSQPKFGCVFRMDGLTGGLSECCPFNMPN